MLAKLAIIILEILKLVIVWCLIATDYALLNVNFLSVFVKNLNIKCK